MATLGDAFNQRKKLGNEIEKWTNRLAQSGFHRRKWLTDTLDGDEAYTPRPGSITESERHYTVEECETQLAALLAEDEALALRISQTNQVAMGTVTDLDGNERTLAIPALLVLRNDIIPKLEAVARAAPTRDDVGDIVDRGDGYVVHRQVAEITEKRETISDHGYKVEETEVTGYTITDLTQYGVPKRQQYDRVDRIQEYAASVRKAINDANQTELVPVDQ